MSFPALFPGRRRRRRSRRGGVWPLVSRLFALNPQKQYLLILISAVLMAALIFSGVLLFRSSDQGDLMTRGKWYVRQGKVALAVREFEQLVRANPNSFNGHLELGKAYMEIDEPDKAAKEFRTASRLRVGNLQESGAHIAISRMMIAQSRYADAEKQLFQAYKARAANRKDKELLLAFVDLYEDWGDWYLEQTPPDYEKAFLRYSSGLRFVKSYKEQQSLQEKLISTASHLADIYDNNKEYDKALAVLKRSLQYDQSADTYMAIAALHEEKDDIDKAIIWYRKAYTVEPKAISLKLASMLMRKGKELNDAHLTKEAEAYFAEAKKINAAIKLPLDVLYPVGVRKVNLGYHVDGSVLNLTPTLSFEITNDGSYPINFLVMKVFFLSGEDKLANVYQIVASSQDPLAPRGEPRGNRQLTLNPNSTIPLEDLEDGKLAVKVFVAYSEAADAKWFEIKNAEITVKGAAAMR